jgi:glucuronate isomerase
VSALELHPDRLLPAGEAERRVAREILASIERLPLISPHGHLDARLFAENAAFGDPAEVLVTSDHYVVRLLHGHGVALRDLGLVPPEDDARPPSGREVWRRLCEHWRALAGTPSRLWLEHQLHELFGLRTAPSPETADESYDQLSERLASDDLRPRSLYERFNLEVLTTTDSPLEDLSLHDALAHDASWTGRLLPTFRPDAVVDPVRPDFADNVLRLGNVAGVGTGSYDGYVEALAARRDAFRARGATATDHGVEVASTEPLGRAYAAAIYQRLRTGDATPGEAAAFRGHMLHEMARLSTEDGMVMQLHTGVLRDYNPELHALYGPDVGQDFPVAREFTVTLRPLLVSYGDRADFRLVLYTLDETTFSREIGPLVSYFPSLYAGPPWWFLDSPDAMGRAFAALGETAGIAKLTGFVDDTRSLLGIGARHDVARRVCSGYLARLVCEHRLPLEEAVELATEYAYRRPKAVFNV